MAVPEDNLCVYDIRMETRIIHILKNTGPLTGSELLEATCDEDLGVWRTCKLSRKLAVRTIGTHYLRLDRNVPGFARISPSILREFLTFSLIGLRQDPDRLEQKAREQISHIEAISRAKINLAYRIASSVVSRFETEYALNNQISFIIAGDIVYNMAHDVPRPERSTGKMVTGSDMDLVVIVDDALQQDLMKKLDDHIYTEKIRLLMAPHLKEEIDYIVKRLARVREQVRFKTFKHMVACKILYEGTFLYGSEKIFSSVKAMLRESDAFEKIKVLEKKAARFRREAEEYLLHEAPQRIPPDKRYLFYPTEESEEFE